MLMKTTRAIVVAHMLDRLMCVAGPYPLQGGVLVRCQRLENQA